MICLICPWICLLATAAAAPAALRCTDITSTSITATWPAAAPRADEYYVALAADEGAAAPYAVQQAGPALSLRLIDLVASTTYFLELRAHAPNETRAWGWRKVGARVRCSTTATRAAAPRELSRWPPSPGSRHEATLRWLTPEPRSRFEIGVRRLNASQLPHSDAAWAWEPVDGSLLEHTVRGRRAGRFEAVVRDVARKVASDPYVFTLSERNTSAMWTESFRISEFQVPSLACAC